jgi:hypothetical protein
MAVTLYRQVGKGKARLPEGQSRSWAPPAISPIPISCAIHSLTVPVRGSGCNDLDAIDAQKATGILGLLMQCPGNSEPRRNRSDENQGRRISGSPSFSSFRARPAGKSEDSASVQLPPPILPRSLPRRTCGT